MMMQSTHDELSGRRVTFSKLLLKRDDEALERKFRVIKVPVNTDGNWKLFHELLAEGASRPDVISTTSDGIDVWTLLPAGSNLTGYAIGDVLPAGVLIHDVPDHILARLLINSCGRIERITDPVNDTGRYLVNMAKEKNMVRAYEMYVSPRMELSVKGRTFTSLKYLLDGIGDDPDGKKRNRLLSKQRFNLSPAGVIIRERSDTEDAYIEKSLKKYRTTFMSFATGEKGRKLVANTKLGQLDRLLTTLRSRYGDLVEFTFAEADMTGFREIRTSDIMKRETRESFGNRSLVVTHSIPSLASSARGLCLTLKNTYGLDAHYMQTVPPHGAAILKVVPDEKSDDDGYGADPTSALQHVTSSVVEKIIVGADRFETEVESDESGKRKKEPPAEIVYSLLKELLVKSDIQSSKVQSFEWPRDGFSSFTIMKAVDMPLEDGCDEDEVEKGLGILEIEASGTMRYISCAIEDYDGSFGDAGSLSRDDGSLDPNSVIVRAVRNGRLLDAKILKTPMFTIPNELHEVLTDGTERCIPQRNSKFWSNRLAPIFGIGTFEYEGHPAYFVGHSKRMNSKLEKASPIRIIEGVLSQDDIDAVLGLLDIGLSRLGQPTVIPIPVKYLNEYARGECSRTGN